MFVLLSHLLTSPLDLGQRTILRPGSNKRAMTHGYNKNSGMIGTAQNAREEGDRQAREGAVNQLMDIQTPDQERPLNHAERQRAHNAFEGIMSAKLDEKQMVKPYIMSGSAVEGLAESENGE
ncbi:hypothetical protein BC826DRAFT_966405 [Russula brevipes]|nr:hypothetical protein BC826DRAFT_966405 [Russula brevipes]